MLDYLYFFFTGFSITNRFGVIIFWILLPISILTLIIISRKKINIPIGYIYFFLISLFFIFLYYIHPYITGEYTSRLNSNFYLSFTGLFISFIYFATNDNIDKSYKYINAILVIHIISFYSQFILYYLFNYTLDYHSILGGSGSRFYWGSLFRATGFFDEPAVYSLHIVTLLVINYLLQKKFSLLSYIAIFSLFLSFSFIAIAQGILLLALTMKNKKAWFLSFLLIITFLLLFKENIISRYDSFIQGGDGSNNTKIETILELFTTNKIYYGFGLVGSHASFPLYYQGLYDLTYWGANLTIFGLFVGTAINIVVITFLIRTLSIREFLLVNVALIKLSVPMYSVYWLFAFFLIWYKRNNNDTKNIYTTRN